jgi:hypothetical protein
VIIAVLKHLSGKYDAKHGDRFLQADFSLLIRSTSSTLFVDNFLFADHQPGFIVSLQVEYKQSIGNGHLIGSSHFSKSATGKTDVSFDI